MLGSPLPQTLVSLPNLQGLAHGNLRYSPQEFLSNTQFFYWRSSLLSGQQFPVICMFFNWYWGVRFFEFFFKSWRSLQNRLCNNTVQYLLAFQLADPKRKGWNLPQLVLWRPASIEVEDKGKISFLVTLQAPSKPFKFLWKMEWESFFQQHSEVPLLY